MDGTITVYFVEKPLAPDEDKWFTVARCVRAEFAAEIVRALLSGEYYGGEVIRVRVEKRIE